ncbi:MAG: hypothetical protein IJ183_00370 [Prevotella sp.]|nr:hypothetical protein [Prevotella sp.]
MSDIRTEIKKTLRLDDNSSDEEILKTIKEELKKYHPNGSEGEEVRKEKTERFTQIHDIYKKFKRTLDSEKKNSTAVVPIEVDSHSLEIANEMDQIQYYYEIAELKNQLKLISDISEDKSNKIEELKKELKQTTEQVIRLKEQKTNGEKEDLLSLYKQNKVKKSWGLIGLLIGIISLLSPIQKIVVQIFNETTSTTISIICFGIFILAFIDWAICSLRTIKVNDIACKLMDGNFLESNISIIEEKSYSASYYISEYSIRELISEELNKSKLNWLFLADSNTTIENIKRVVISHYLEFGIFTSRKMQKLGVWFKINYEKNTGHAFETEF